MSLRSRQTLMARFLSDPAFEASVRESPEQTALQMGVPLEEVMRLLSVEPRRIRAFRASQQVKARRRLGDD